MEPIPKVLPSETEVARLIEPDAYTLSDLEWHDAYGRTTSVTRSLEERGYVRRAALSRARSVLALLAGQPTVAQVKAEALRDEYHTMDELYEYRMLYNALAANAMPELACKSWRHSDGDLCFGGGWFVVYLTLPTGQVSNHYKAEHWDLFQVPAVELAPPYDGHTPQDAAQRLLDYLEVAND